MARRKRVNLYKNPRAPKNIDFDAPRKRFQVAEHASIHIQDEDGVVRKYSGRQSLLDCGEGEKPEPVYVMLTEEMATYFGNLGYIEVELDFGTEKDAEITTLKSRAVNDAETIASLQRRIAELEAAGELSAEKSPDDAAISALIQNGADATVGSDGAENGSGDNADSGGAEPSGGPSSGSVPKTGKSSGRRGRKAL